MEEANPPSFSIDRSRIFRCVIDIIIMEKYNTVKYVSANLYLMRLVVGCASGVSYIVHFNRILLEEEAM